MKEEEKKKNEEKQIEDIQKGKWNEEEGTDKKKNIRKEIENIQKGERSEIKDIPEGAEVKGKATEKDLRKIQKSK